jgi:uncharacterized membrane protein YbhN (UPF0104 family)
MALTSMENNSTLSEGNSTQRTVLPAVVGYSIVGVFLALCAYYIHGHWNDFAFVITASLPELAMACLLILLSLAISAMQLGMFLRHFGLNLGRGELMAVTMGISLGNFLIPMRGGSGGLAVYLKKVHGLNFHDFAAIYGGTGLLASLVNSGLALLALAFLGLFHGFFHTGLTVVVVGLFVFCLYLSLFPPPVRWKRKGLLGMVFEAARSWHLLTRDRNLLMALGWTFLGVAFALAGVFFFIYRALGVPLSVSAVLITSSLGNIAGLVPLTPGSLGVFDAVMIQVPQFFGLDVARSIAAALVFRVLWFLWGLSLGIPGLIYMFRRAKTSA